MLRASLVAFVLVSGVSLPAGSAEAQVRRCSLADGGTVYTDRRCEDIGGTEWTRPATAGATPARLGRPSCARSVQDLAYTLGNAIQSGDANQIAGVYDWAGTSTSTGYRLMQRLDAIARRPLVDVQPVYAGGTDAYGYDLVEFDEATGQVVNRPPRRPRLIGLRVDQTLSNGSTPSRTMFGLRRNLGCWWVRL
jgi:hypothetical protein